MYSPLLRQILILALLSTGLMIIDQSTDWFKPARVVIDQLMRPFYWVTNIPGNVLEWGEDNLVGKSELIEKNEQLKQEIVIYRGRLQRLSELATENLRLMQLLNASELLVDRILLTKVIGISPTIQRHTITIDKGAKNGAYVGQPVLDSEGLMGQLIRVYDHHSVVLLITDARHALPVKVLRNGVRSIAEGRADYQRLTLRYVSPTADIKLGDQLLSSGLGGRYPAGYPVGKGVEIQDITGSVFMAVEVAPSALLDRSSHLLLVFTMDQNGRSKNKL